MIDLVVVLVVLSSILAVVAHFATAGGGTSTSTTATPAATATATPPPPPTTLYQADWSQGADGWALPAGWHASGGQLTIDGGDAGVAVPYVPTASRYTVEIDIDVRAVLIGPQGPNSGFFGVSASDAGGARLYDAYLQCFHPAAACIGFDQVIATHPRDEVENGANSTADFSSGAGVKPYFVVVTSDTVNICPDDACVGAMASSVPLAPAHLVFYAHNVELTVARFVITTP